MGSLINKYSYIFITILIILLLILSLFPASPIYSFNWALLSSIIAVLLLAMFFLSFERKEQNSRRLVLIATIAALAAVSRVAFAPLANVTPSTFIVMITGYVFGPTAGFMTGAMSALVSNLFLGQGPWTPWQMLSWGICGLVASALGARQKDFNRIAFTVLAGICGYVFGILMNLWHWTAFVYPLNWNTLAATCLSSLVMDSMHAGGNVVFSLVFGPAFYRILMRYKGYM